MPARKRFTWLISPKNFIQVIGAEYDILRKSGSASLLKFYIAAVVIFAILLISACSILYAMELLFHILHVELVLAIFVSLLFVFIYVFLLNTFSKNIFKQKEDKGAKTWYQKFKLSDIIRTGFVVFMAFLISKPIEAFIFRTELTEKVKAHRVEILGEYNQKLERLNGKDIRQLENSIALYEEQVSYPSPMLLQEIAKLSTRISAIKNKQKAEMQQAGIRVDRSDFLLFRINEVSKNGIAWVICAGMIGLFLLPGFLIYSISATDAYYKLKREYEISIVLEEYQAFEDLYTDIFKQSYQLDRIYYTKFLDPPFNSKPKSNPTFQTQSDFFKKYSCD